MINLCDDYYLHHIAGAKYFAFDIAERTAALNSAKTDLASCGAAGIDEKAPDVLKAALFEQVLYILVNKESYTGKAREVVSESIDGVGSCRYAESDAPAYISPRAFALVKAFFSVGSIHISRG